MSPLLYLYLLALSRSVKFNPPRAKKVRRSWYSFPVYETVDDFSVIIEGDMKTARRIYDEFAPKTKTFDDFLETLGNVIDSMFENRLRVDHGAWTVTDYN